MKLLIKRFRQKAAPIRSSKAFETSDFLRGLAGVSADRCSVSLWSHLPDSLFQRWLSSVCAALNPGGYLFSTHGANAATIVPQLAEVIKDGRQYGHLDGSDQKNLDPSIYGSTIVLPPYVIKAIYGATKGRIISFKPAGWRGSLQDEWIIQVP